MRGRVEELGLRGVVEEERVEEVVEAIRGCWKLRKLDLSDNTVALRDDVLQPLMLTDQELMQITSSSGSSCSKTKVLQPARVDLGMDVDSEVADSRNCVLTLTEVNVSGCANVTAEFRQEWRKRRRRLRLIDGVNLNANAIAVMHRLLPQ